MSEFGTPSEIAREVLRQLAQRRIQPTPENFSQLYAEIAGTPADEAYPERHLRQVAASLPRATPEQLQIALAFDNAVSEGSWQGFRAQLGTILAARATPSIPWVPLLRSLVEQLQRTQEGLSPESKREALDRALEADNGGTEEELLHPRLLALTKSWAQLPTQPEKEERPPITFTRETLLEITAAPEAWRHLIAEMLDGVADILLAAAPELATEAQELGRDLRGPDNNDIPHLHARIAQLFNRIEWATHDREYVRNALLQLLQLVVENISELVIEDKWLLGQLGIIRELVAKPLDRNILDEVGNRLRDVILKQGELKRNLTEAQSRLRNMLADFIERLGKLADSTGAYHGKISAFADRIAQAASLEEMSGLVEDIVKETRLVETNARASQEELQALRASVDEANKEITRLESELEQTSALVRHDPLTGSLNRKGLEETLVREVARSQRRNTVLCLAMLDVDNFKRLNDSFGHATGDKALKHLAAVIRENLRPQDACGRYGGEEFLLLLPDTRVADAASTLQRLQRELTRRFFLHDNQRMLITFSAGVTEMRADEDSAHAVHRADQAMYAAKRAGKNRVEMA